MTLGDLFLLVRVSAMGWGEPVEGLESFFCSNNTSSKAEERPEMWC